MIADRVDRRRVMLASNLVAGGSLLGLVAAMTLWRADLPIVYAVAAVLAACDVTYTLAMQGSFPDVVASPGYLATANGRLMSVEGAGEQFLGPGIGGTLFSLAKRLPFFADGVSFFVSALLVRTAVPRRVKRGRHAAGPAVLGTAPATAGARAGASASAGTGAGAGEGTVAAEYRGRHQQGSGWTSDFRQGVRLFRKQTALKVMAASVSSIAFSQSMVLGLLVVYAERRLHLSSTGYGVFVALASLMGVAGAFSGGALQRRFGAARVIIGGSALVAISYVGLAATRTAVLAVFVLGLQEVGSAVVNVGSLTARQRIIPRNLYGRVNSVHRLMVAGSAPLGALLGGAIASWDGVPMAMFAAGVLAVVSLVVLTPPLVASLASSPAAGPGPSGAAPSGAALGGRAKANGAAHGPAANLNGATANGVGAPERPGPEGQVPTPSS